MKMTAVLVLLLLVLSAGNATAQIATDSLDIGVSVIDSSADPGPDPDPAVFEPSEPADPPAEPDPSNPIDPSANPDPESGDSDPLEVSGLPNTGSGPLGQAEGVQSRSVLAGISMLMVGVAGVAFTYESWNQGLTGQRVEERNVS